MNHSLKYFNYKINSLSVDAISSKWFKGTFLSTAIGCQTTAARSASVIASFVLVPLYTINDTLYLPLLSTVILCVISFISVSFAAIFDKRSDKYDGNRRSALYEPP